MSEDIFPDIDLSKAPMNSSEVDERLKALSLLDTKIVKLLEAASSAFEALESGKKSSGDSEAAKKEFTERSQAYYSLLEDISVNLRKEARLFHYASKESVLPVTIPVKVDWVGALKEKEVWQDISKLLE